MGFNVASREMKRLVRKSLKHTHYFPNHRLSFFDLLANFPKLLFCKQTMSYEIALEQKMVVNSPESSDKQES